MKYIGIYLVAAVIFLSIDALWLGYLARDFYRERLGAILLEQPRLGVAAGFYALYVAGLLYFAVIPALNAGSIGLAAFNAALFGMFCYMTYDATNLATVKGFDATVAVADVVWGTFLSTFTACVTYWAAHRFSLWDGASLG